jgi:sigma-B regulation protein RsbU (phosphoserine phosphatase)
MAIRKSTRIWGILFAVAMVMLVAGGRGGDNGPWIPLGVLLGVVSGSVLTVRVAVFLSQRLFYRLSWRLAFSYLLIGVFPVPLLALLLGIAAAMTLGQFQAYRVDQAVRQLGSKMLAGEVLGVRRARLAGGTVVSSEIPSLSVGNPAPAWLPGLSEPRFIGDKTAEFLAISSTRSGETIVDALPADDLLYARLAELSGVAIKPIGASARTDTRRSGLTISVDKHDRDQRTSVPFIYPPNAIPADHSGSPIVAVSWFYTSPAVLGEEENGAKERRTVAMLTRLSWKRALSELFAQGAIHDKDRNLFFVGLLVIGTVLLGVYLVALLIAFLLVRTITKTVNRLSRATRNVAAGDFTVRIATRARDQVGDLARSFDSMAASLESTLRDQAAKEILDREIEQARMIAQKLLPGPAAELPGLRLAAFFEPFAQMGGDYYDYLRTKEGHPAIAVGDVSGHGLPTALLVSAAKAALDTLLESGEIGSSLFLRLNRLLHRSTDTRNYMTLALATIRPEGTLELTNAGHPPPYLLSRDGVRPIELPAFPLGLFEGKEFPTRSYPFGTGDRLVLYTDGIIECRDGNDDAFGFERFESVLRERARAPLEELRQAILEAVSSHCSTGVFDDDRTLVLCERI